MASLSDEQTHHKQGGTEGSAVSDGRDTTVWTLGERPKPMAELDQPKDFPHLRDATHLSMMDTLFQGQGKQERVCYSVTADSDELEEVISGREYYIDHFTVTGHGKVFSDGWAQLPSGFHEFLSAIREHIIYSFDSVDALRRFTEKLSHALTSDASLDSQMHIELRIFADDNIFNAMDKHGEERMAHGYFQNAKEHLRDWMDALAELDGVQTGKNQTIVDLVMCHPFKDFRALRWQTARLRNQGRTPQVILPAGSA